MLENIIVGVILVAAAGFTVYRLFFRPSCGCGSDCGCGKGKCGCSGPDEDHKDGGGCCCGK